MIDNDINFTVYNDGRIHTTYTVPKSYHKEVGVDVVAPGVDMESNQKEFRYHKYYQWVCFVLFFQSTLFYIPRWLWKMWEGGKIQALMMDLDVGVCSDQEKKQKKKLLVDYLYNSRGHHDWYAARYFFCEILALSNVLAQMYLLDLFFGGEFLKYGLQVIEFSQQDQGSLCLAPVSPPMLTVWFGYRRGQSGPDDQDLSASDQMPVL